MSNVFTLNQSVCQGVFFHTLKKMHPYRTLGANIRRQRVAAGLTQMELAERCDLSWRYEQDLESGLKCPSVPSLLRLRRALGCKWDDLLAKL